MSGGQVHKFQIFREKDAKELLDSEVMSINELTPVQAQAFAQINRPELTRGDCARVLFNIPGFSLVHVWFKKDYPLPLHSHDADCLYYIVAGSLRLGTEELGPRDGFFIPAGAPYRYRPGPQGVELLEFRHATHFDANVLANTEAFWKRAVETVQANSREWKTAKMPPLNV